MIKDEEPDQKKDGGGFWSNWVLAKTTFYKAQIGLGEVVGGCLKALVKQRSS